MESKFWLGVLVVFCTEYNAAFASHFRGGTVSWKFKASHGNVNEIEVNYMLGWLRTSGDPLCDDESIRDRLTGYSNGGWQISTNTVSMTANGTTLAQPPTDIICTTYDIFENWAYGYNSFELSVDTNDPFSISYVGGNWISGLYSGGGSHWAVPAIVDLVVRSDTGRINNPPTTFSPPVVRLQQGCSSTIAIRFVDEDGDNVTCRYAKSSSSSSSRSSSNPTSVDECGGICNSKYPHFTLDEKTCTIHYDGGGGQYLIPVALILEDHPLNTISLNGNRIVRPNESLSLIPLQFLVDVTSTTTACNVVPSYPPNAINENDAFTISQSGGELSEVLYAYPSNPAARITQFVVLGPLGVQVSAPIYIDGTAQSIGEYASNITWHPQPNQAGKHIICYYAVDSLGKIGKQVCFQVVVSAISNPCEVDNGGCNDVCLPQGPIRTCGCSVSCWRMLSNMKTCAPPMDVTCSGEGVQISMPSCASSRTVKVGSNEGHFTQSVCQSTDNGINHNIQFKVKQCGMTIWSNPYEIEYVLDLWIWHQEERVSSIITRGEWRRIPVTCSLESTGNVNGFFIPQLPYNDEFFPNDVTIEGMGKFSFYFEFYKSGSFENIVHLADYPLQVEVGQRMYFSLGAVGQGGLVLFTEECTASTSSPDGLSTLIYTFIKDGCFLDSTLRRHTSSSPMQDWISMEAFEFEKKLLVNREDAGIFIQCQVMLCDAANNATRCYQGCQPSSARRKRATTQLSGHVRSRVIRETKHDDDHTSRMSKSESPPQTASTRIRLSRFSTADDPSSTGTANYGNWMMITAVQYLLARCLGRAG